MSLILDIRQPEWISTFLSELGTSKIEKVEAEQTISEKHLYTSRGKSITNMDIIDLKEQVDQVFIRKSVLEIVKALKTISTPVTLGVDFNNNNLFLWIELNDIDKIENEVEQTLEFKKSELSRFGLQVRYIIMPSELQIQMPPDYTKLSI